jgi:protein O-mannosyl-transferase
MRRLATPKAKKVSWKEYSLLVLLCFLFYGNTLTCKYALDDLMVITGNEFVKKGISGIGDILTTDSFTGYYGKGQNVVAGGRYRPLSLITFAIEVQIFGEEPFVSHLINILLLACTAILLFDLLRRLFRMRGRAPATGPWYLGVPLVAALLFIAHPVHTEVVANIKGRDELLCLLLALLAVSHILDYLEKKKNISLIWSGVVFFFALLSKESAITFLAAVPLTLWFFTKSERKQYFITLAPLAIATVLFLLIRQSMLSHAPNSLQDDLMNNPFAEMTSGQKFATILYTLGLYLKLLVWPHPLTYDYYPYHIPIVNLNEAKALIPLLIYIAIIVYALIAFRKKSLASWAILFFLVTISIASNILFPIGVFMNERFLYIPSLAFCLLLAWLLFEKLPSFLIPRPSAYILHLTSYILLLLLILAAVKTISRNRDWYDSYTLFTTDVKVSTNSAKGNAVAGEYLMVRAEAEKEPALRDSLFRESIRYQEKAIRIYPKQMVALINLAATWYEYNRNYDSVVATYKKILEFLPDSPDAWKALHYMLSKCEDPDRRIRLYKELLPLNPDRFDVNFNLGVIYHQQKNDPVSAEPYLRKAVKADPSYYDASFLLGIGYAIRGRWASADTFLEQAYRLRGDNPDLLKNLAAINQNLGRKDKMKEYLELAEKATKK